LSHVRYDQIQLDYIDSDNLKTELIERNKTTLDYFYLPGIYLAQAVCRVCLRLFWSSIENRRSDHTDLQKSSFFQTWLQEVSEQTEVVAYDRME